MSGKSSSQEMIRAGKVLNDIMEKKDWKENEIYISKARAAINSLVSVKVTKELLKSTGVGRTVRNFSKHSDKIIQGYCKQLVKEWMKAVGVAPPRNDSKKLKLEAARAKLRNNYAAENAKKDSRTLQVLSKHPTQGRKKKGPVVTVGGAATRFNGFSSASGRTFRSLPTSPVDHLPVSNRVQRKVSQPKRNDADAAHKRRQEILRARARATIPPASTSSYSRAPVRNTTAPKSTGKRSEMLAKMFPRIRGVPSAVEANGKRGKKPMSVGEKQVYEWLQGLLVDMSQYAAKFFAQGFDSVAILKTIRSNDLTEIVEKKAHRRIIAEALAPMRKKRSRPESSNRVRSCSDLDDYEEDGFVVNSDEDEMTYRPGMVSNMMKKRYAGRAGTYSDDSSDMEASFDEILNEEDQSAHYGELEDEREERRNKEMERRKKKRKV